MLGTHPEVHGDGPDPAGHRFALGEFVLLGVRSAGELHRNTVAKVVVGQRVVLHLESATNVTNWLGTPRAAMASIITVQAWRTIPFATVIFIAGISSIPQEVDDAAAIDGATGLRKFWHVSLPLQLPIALVAVLFGIIFTATDMVVPYILTDGGPFNSTHVLTTWAFQIGIVAGNVGEGAAIALFMLPLLAVVTIAMLFFARRAEVT